MDDAMLRKCLARLGAMNSGVAWDDDQREVYAEVLAPIETAVAVAAVKTALATMKWRPAPAELLELVADHASPLPAAKDVYAELMDKAQRYGVYGARDPERPGVYKAGEPRWSHPVISQVVRYLGGWTMICQGEAQFQEGLSKQVEASMAAILARWRAGVNLQLRLPAEQRDMRYFPEYRPPALKLQAPFTAPAIVSRPEPPVNPMAMPDPVRKLLGSLRAMPGGAQGEAAP